MALRESFQTCSYRLSPFLRALGDLLMPRACLVCGCTLGARERHLCLACAADVPYTYDWLQAHNPLADRFNAVLERHRGTEPVDYAFAAALMYYKGPYRQIPKALKYHSDIGAGRYYGALLGRRLAAAPHFADIDLVIPVPLHWTRRRSRGYNQAEVLARAITRSLNASRPLPGSGTSLSPALTPPVIPGMSPPVIPGSTSRVIPCLTPSVIPGLTGNLSSATDSPQAARPVSFAVCRTDLLVRARRTRTQTRLSVEQKARNVASAFRVPLRARIRWPVRMVDGEYRDGRWPVGAGHDAKHPSPPDVPRHSRLDRESDPRKVLASARHILLVDDTFTTGATLYACYAALRPFTSARISVATLAAVEGTPSSVP